MSSRVVNDGESLYLKNDTGGTISQRGLVLVGAFCVGLVTAIDGGATTLADASYGMQVRVCGEIEVAKAAVAINQGDPIYVALGTSPAATNVPTLANYFLGYATQTVASGASTVKVKLKPFKCAPPRYVLDTTATIAITAAALLDAGQLTVVTSNTGAIAMTIPAAASWRGKEVNIIHSAGTSAITITPASGTIAGGATHSSMDAAGDRASFLGNLADWTVKASTIA